MEQDLRIGVSQKFIAGPLYWDIDKIVSEIDKTNFISRFVTHQVVASFIDDQRDADFGGHFPNRHYYAILWTVGDIENVEEKLSAVFEHKSDDDDLLRWHVNNRSQLQRPVLIRPLNKSCVYISRFGLAQEMQDQELTTEIVNLVGRESVQKVLICSMDKIDLRLDNQEQRPAVGRPFVRQALRKSVNAGKAEDAVEYQDFYQHLSEEERIDDLNGMSKGDRVKFYEERHRFVLLWVRTKDEAESVMRKHHNKYTFDSETASRFEILGYEANTGSTLTHELTCSEKRCCARFCCALLWKVLFYPLPAWICYCPNEKNDQEQFEDFQDRLGNNPGRIFRFYRPGWNSFGADNGNVCKLVYAILRAFFVWLVWTILLVSGLCGIFLYGGRNDNLHPLTFVETFFQLVGYSSFCFFIATWISRRVDGVTGYEHELLYHNFEVYPCTRPKEGEPILSDVRGLLALKPKPLRISVIQYMYQYQMLTGLKFHLSPFCSIHSAFNPTPDPLTNEVSAFSYCMQWIRYICNFVMVVGFGFASKIESLYWNKQYHGLAKFYSWWGCGVSTLWFLVLVWCAATVFVRMNRYLNSLKRLGLLLSNKLTNFYMPSNRNSVDNIHAWCTTRNYIVRTGELVFSSIELHCLFTAIFAGFSLCSLIFCYVYGQGVTSWVLSNSSFVAWAYLTVFFAAVIGRIMYCGYAFAKVEKRVIRRLIKHQTDFSEEVMAQENYPKIKAALDMLIRKVQNVSVVPKLFGTRVDGLLFPTVLLSVISATPTILARFWIYLGL